MTGTLVDSNVLLDVLSEDPHWFAWSSDTLKQCAEDSILVINAVIYAEVSIRFETVEELEEALPRSMFERRDLPWEAAFLAGKCFARYRRAGGPRTVPLPDFFIGAHAAVENLALLSRDPGRYRTYFPRVRLLTPEDQGPLATSEWFRTNTTPELFGAQLFLDDRWIDQSLWLTRDWHQPRKFPRPVLAAEHPWERWCPVLFGSAMHWQGLYRMW
jgi:predicted nucleic acid-binding protein